MSLPNDFPEWSINDNNKNETPLTSFANEGFDFESKPSYKLFNFFFNRLSQLYRAIVSGALNDKGINPYNSELECEIMTLKGKISELEDRLSRLEV